MLPHRSELQRQGWTALSTRLSQITSLNVEVHLVSGKERFSKLHIAEYTMFSTRQQLHNFFLLLGSTCILFRAQLKHQCQVYLLQLVTILKFINTLLKHSSQGNSFRTILNGVESNSGLHWFCITSLCDWSRKLAPLSKAITCKTKSNHDLVARVFPRFPALLAVCLFLL